MKRVLFILWTVMISSPLFAGEDALLLPGTVAVWQDGPQPLIGLSLKRVQIPENQWFSLGSAEVRVFYPSDGVSRADLSWPAFFGFLHPGISLEWEESNIDPWVYGEVDLFYFPFAFAAFMLSEKPFLIPSVYMAVRTDFQQVVWETGVRLSFPIHRRRP